MKIYSFHEGEIHSLEVKETKSRFTAKNRSPAFGWRLYFDKTKVSTSEREEIEKSISYRMKNRGELKINIEEIDHELNVLHQLLGEL